jgi:cytoplasmic iron level regulating protein YaaA (DUF328/UPF0246 family)
MIAILSPAKNLDYNTSVGIKTFTAPVFVDKSTQLIKGLQKLSPKKIGELMSISPKLAELNYQRYQDWKQEVEAPNESARQAIFAFNGEVYNGFDAHSLKIKDIEFAQNKVFILSGIYGVLRPLDLIQPYRLEMGTSFGVGKAKNLYQFWDSQVSNFIAKELESHKEKTLINLASTEYSKVVDLKNFPYPVITCHFKEEKNGEFKTIMIYAKKARGLMARYIIENKIEKSEKLKAFNSEGYLFNDELSDDKNWFFTRIIN